jgi:hypothetical protein
MEKTERDGITKMVLSTLTGTDVRICGRSTDKSKHEACLVSEPRERGADARDISLLRIAGYSTRD